MFLVVVVVVTDERSTIKSWVWVTGLSFWLERDEGVV
jgi:hypothetical protein